VLYSWWSTLPVHG